MQRADQRLGALRFLHRLLIDLLHAEGDEGPDVRRLRERLAPALARLLEQPHGLTATERVAALRLAAAVAHPRLRPALEALLLQASELPEAQLRLSLLTLVRGCFPGAAEDLRRLEGRLAMDPARLGLLRQARRQLLERCPEPAAPTP